MSTAPLNAFPMRIDWEMTKPCNAGPQPFPAPLVAARPVLDPPGPVKSLQATAEGWGWATLLQYAHGWYPHATTGRPGAAPKESVAVRLRRGTEGAVAVYVMGSAASWGYLYYWSPVQPWTKLRTLGDFLGAIA